MSEKITREDLYEVFGDQIPMEALQIVWGAEPELTVSAVRKRLDFFIQGWKARGERETSATAKLQMLHGDIAADAMRQAHVLTLTNLRNAICDGMAGDEEDVLAAVVALLTKAAVFVHDDLEGR